MVDIGYVRLVSLCHSISIVLFMFLYVYTTPSCLRVPLTFSGHRYLRLVFIQMSCSPFNFLLEGVGGSFVNTQRVFLKKDVKLYNTLATN